MTSPRVEPLDREGPAAQVPDASASSKSTPSTPPRASLTVDAPHDNESNNADDVHEASPLLSPASSSNEQNGFLGGNGDGLGDSQATKSIWYLILLTISIGGLQIAWSVELSNGSPYLLSLGLSKSLMALVWIAGPLTGTLVQPYVGMLSDRCRIPWGKRKPFMLGGAAATIVSLMVLAWSKNIVTSFLGLFGADPASQGVKVSTIVFAVIWVYILDFAINTVQAAIRAFIVDCAPAHQQEAANAMASRITGVGNIVGYIAGYVNLPKIMWWLGDTQFKCLCAIASVALGATVLVSMTIKERDPRLDRPEASTNRPPGLLAFFKTLFTSIKRLPPQTKKVCIVQFCAWVGFFPMLFYTSSYIGEIYVQPYLEANPHMTPQEVDELYEKATRVGTFALLIFAITSLTTNVFLPLFIAPSYDNQPTAEAPGEGPATSLGSKYDETKSWTDCLIIPGLTLRRAWMYSQLLFMVSMLCTVAVRTVPAATVLVGLVGITWALTLWAPFAIISAEISRRDLLARQKQRAFSSSHQTTAESPAAGPSRFDGYSSDQDHKLDETEPQTDQAGVILGIHNMAIAAPQIIATVGSSLVFKIFQKPRGTPGDHSIAIVMAIGGVMVGASAWFIHLIQDEAEEYSSIKDTLEAGVESGETDDMLGSLAHPSLARPSLEGRNKSFSRRSLDRATLVRSKSSTGLDYM
ncbi:major facilitator superfamily domain-containing protein [Coniella lustricola]|uniref:Major facilitator superfamily domain-containing protein n=1 Tax=Coniella lustricola TaxID=2025994 RepID=A0A2T3ABC9_9PEZI|nr:major facilitator superfamily domain-containing protein [Coniella lustricola]